MLQTETLFQRRARRSFDHLEHDELGQRLPILAHDLREVSFAEFLIDWPHCQRVFLALKVELKLLKLILGKDLG